MVKNEKWNFARNSYVTIMFYKESQLKKKKNLPPFTTFELSQLNC